MIAPVLLALAGLMLAMAGAHLVSERSGRSGYTDGIWSLATAAAAIALVLIEGDGWRALLLALLLMVWGVRLGGHILLRTGRAPGDDPRYAALRRDWGEEASSRMFRFLQSQAVAGWLLALSVTAGAGNDGAFGWTAVSGVLLALAGLGVETIADRQLAAFRASAPDRGAVCDYGLWGRSRHPNYFGEWLFWSGVALVGLDLGTPSWREAAVLAAPLMIYGLLVHVSGIPPLERHMRESRGPAWESYAARVPAFFPRLR